jgi:hypothetical protein
LEFQAHLKAIVLYFKASLSLSATTFQPGAQEIPHLITCRPAARPKPTKSIRPSCLLMNYD